MWHSVAYMAIFTQDMYYITVTGEQLKGTKSLILRGNLNHIRPDKTHDRINLQAIAYKLPRLPLSEQPEWPVALEGGLADIKIRAGIKGEALRASVKGSLRSLRISAGKPNDSNILTKALSSAITGISRLSVRADITGTTDTYNVKITSDLDRVLQRAAGKMVRDLSNRFQKQLTREISREVNGPLQDLRGTYGGLNQIGLDLTGRLTQGNDVLESLLKKSISPKGLPGGLKLPF